MFPSIVFALLKNRPVIVQCQFKYKICTNSSKQTIHHRKKGKNINRKVMPKALRRSEQLIYE